MVFMFWKKKKKEQSPPKADPSLDRVAFLRETRNEILANLGLPPDTPAEEFQRRLENKDRQRKLKRALASRRKKKG
jgi:hypothetical protein